MSGDKRKERGGGSDVTEKGARGIHVDLCNGSRTTGPTPTRAANPPASETGRKGENKFVKGNYILEGLCQGIQTRTRGHGREMLI